MPPTQILINKEIITRLVTIARATATRGGTIGKSPKLTPPLFKIILSIAHQILPVNITMNAFRS